MFLMTDTNRNAVISTANFKRGKDKVKRKSRLFRNLAIGAGTVGTIAGLGYLISKRKLKAPKNAKTIANSKRVKERLDLINSQIPYTNRKTQNLKILNSDKNLSKGRKEIEKINIDMKVQKASDKLRSNKAKLSDGTNFSYNTELAQFKRGKDKTKRKKKGSRTDYDRTINTVKTGQKVASTGTNISREIRGWWKLINRGKLAAERLAQLKRIKNLND